MQLIPLQLPFSFPKKPHVQSLKKSWIIPLLWWLTWISFHHLYLVYSGWSAEISITDSLVSNVILAALCSGALFSAQYNNPEPRKMVVFFFGVLIAAAFCSWLISQALSEILSENQPYLQFLESTSVIRFLIALFMISLFALIGWLTYFLNQRIEEKSRAAEVSRFAKESELILLRQQLQPHFLFNTLNSVSALITINPPAAKKMILELSDFLRGTLKKDDHALVSLSEELQQLKLYLEIEKVRFGNRLDSIITVDPTTENLKIPIFLLQPLVENAIKFGLYDTIGKVDIELKASLQDNTLIITIINPFDPSTSKALSGTGYGLNAVSRRLFLLYNRTDLLEIFSSENKFTAVIKIPQLHA